MHFEGLPKDYEYQDTSKCYIGFRCVKTNAAVKS